MEALATLRGVTKWFGREQVLKGADLALPRGTVTALLGRNGCGKSTLMRILVGLLGRDGGQAQVLGRDPEELGPDERLRLSYVTDTGTALGNTRVEDELALHRGLRGARWDPARERELLARFEVPARKRVGALSKGQQTRLRLVCALSADPELLVLDEPALGLDLFARKDLLETVIETVEREGRAVLITSHLLDDVERIADRVAFMREGRVTVGGSVDELRDRFRRVRLALGPEGEQRLSQAAGELMGVRRLVPEREAPPCERTVVLEDFTEDLLAQLEARSGARRLEVHRMALRDIYFEVLAGREEEVVA